MPAAVLDDGSQLNLCLQGNGIPLLVPSAAPGPGSTDCLLLQGPTAELIDGLAEHATVIAFDYEAHRLEHPRSTTLTLDTVARDMLAIADSVGAEEFAYLGHSWLALVGPHLASVTNRVQAIAMGGFPPLHPPLTELLDLAIRNHRTAIAWHHRPLGGEEHRRPSSTRWPSGDARRYSSSQARQFVTFFDDAQGTPSLARAQILSLSVPRLCFVEDGDALPGPMDQRVPVKEHVLGARRVLEQAGWEVAVLDARPDGGEPRAGTALDVLLPWLASAAPPRQPGSSVSAENRTRWCSRTRHKLADEQAHGFAYADRIDAYLGSCGVPEKHFDDDVLRTVTEQLLDLRANRRNHLESAQRDSPEVSHAPRARTIGVTSHGPDHRERGAGPGSVPGRTQELLEVAIIRRLTTLLVEDHERRPGSDGHPRDLRMVEDD